MQLVLMENRLQDLARALALAKIQDSVASGVGDAGGDVEKSGE